MKFWKTFKQRSQKTAESLGRYQEAGTYSQAGAREQALNVLRQGKEEQEPEAPHLLLVLSQGASFPREMRDYALTMAKRLEHSIIALNTAPLKREALQFLNLEKQRLRQEFQAEAEQEFAAFQAEAEAQGVPIEHAVKFIDKEEALAEICSQHPGIDFVISDSETVQTNLDRASQELRPGREICVYSVIA